VYPRYQKRRQLTSLIWCYNISKPWFTVVDGENLNLVKDISGPNVLKNVTVLTTNWNKGAGGVANAAKTRTVAAAAAPLQRFKNAESSLRSLYEGVEKSNWKRFGTFSDKTAQQTLGSASAGDPLKLIQSLLSNDEEVFRVQQEACETRKLAGTTAGMRLQRRLEAEIQRKERDIAGLDGALNGLDDDDAERKDIQGEKEEAELDIKRWRGTLEEIGMVNSAFV
jgi:hypothetical protein